MYNAQIKNGLRFDVEWQYKLGGEEQKHHQYLEKEYQIKKGSDDI